MERAWQGAEKAKWAGRISFLAMAIHQSAYTFDKTYKAWWYYEYDIDGRYYFIFMKIDSDKKSDAKLAEVIINELRFQQQHLGFAIHRMNENKQPKLTGLEL